MILILEDSNDKLHGILCRYGEMLLASAIFIARSQEEAETFVRLNPQSIYLFLDQEVVSGTGYEFLLWMLSEHAHWLERVVITTCSLEYERKMQQLCDSRSIPVEKLR